MENGSKWQRQAELRVEQLSTCLKVIQTMMESKMRMLSSVFSEDSSIPVLRQMTKYSP